VAEEENTTNQGNQIRNSEEDDEISNMTPAVEKDENNTKNQR